MDCKNVKEAYDLWRDRELSGPQETNIIEHLDACADCATLFDQNDKALGALTDWAGNLGQMPETLRVNLQQIPKNQQPSVYQMSAQTTFWKPLALAACLLLAVLGGYQLGQFQQDRPTVTPGAATTTYPPGTTVAAQGSTASVPLINPMGTEMFVSRDQKLKVARNAQGSTMVIILGDAQSHKATMGSLSHHDQATAEALQPILHEKRPELIDVKIREPKKSLFMPQPLNLLANDKKHSEEE